MTTQKQKDSAINRTFKRLKKIAARKDKNGYNPYQGIYYFNDYFYVTDSICMVKVSYDAEMDIPGSFRDSYFKVNIIELVDQVIPLINLSQDDKTNRMNFDHNSRGIQIFDRFFDMGGLKNEIAIDPKRLSELLDIFATNKLISTVTQDASKINLFGSNDFCRMEAVLMGIRK